METPVVISIRVDRTEPLSGTAAADEGGRRLAFRGWMDLIGAIAELLATTQDERKGYG